jgi:putative chitinase
MNLTTQQLLGCMPEAGDRAPIFVDALNDAMTQFDITTLGRQACFLAQVAQESGSLRYTREIWGPTPAQLRYEGDVDRLGNTQQGDGKRYLGRGLIQVTGRSNTLACLSALGRAEDDLEYLEKPIGAARSAGWFFKSHSCNQAADLGNFWSVSKTINGGTNGLDERIKHYIRIRKVLGI